MHSKYIVILLLLMSQLAIGQNILVRKIKTDINVLNKEKLADKFITACSDDFSHLAVDLDLTLLQEEDMKALDSKTVVSAELTIKAYSLITEKLLGTKYIKIISTASNATKAKKGLLSRIVRKRKVINKALNDIVSENPNKDCASIQRAIENYLNRRAYKEAFSLSNLGGTDCDNTLENLRIKAYNNYQTQYCDEHLRRSKTYLANREFDKAVAEIIKISPESNCNEGVKDVVKELSAMKDAIYSDSYEAYIKYLEMSTLERRDRLDMIRLLQVKHLLND